MKVYDLEFRSINDCGEESQGTGWNKKFSVIIKFNNSALLTYRVLWNVISCILSCRMSCSISGLYPLDVNIFHLQLVATEAISCHCDIILHTDREKA